MAAVMTPQKSPPPPVGYSEGEDYVVDTRTSSPVLRSTSNDEGSDKEAAKAGEVNKVESGPYQPDLSSEVAMLSTKLINAINYQTNLDDSLQSARHDLDQAHTELRRVRAEKQSLDDAIAQGVLVRKAEFERTIAQLRVDLAEEKARRENAERLKKQTEGELENLTSALFEEANTMVAAARKDTEAAEKRNSQLKSQLQDTEFLIASQQEQLQDLKHTMEKLDQSNSETRDSSVPSTPVLGSSTAAWDAMQDSPNAVDISPEHPLYFSQLVHPVLRTDVSSYNDFAELLSVAKKAAPHSRSASGNVASSSQTHLASTNSSTNPSNSPSLPGAFSFSASANSSPSSSTFAVVPALKDSKFYKRILVEDIEPTLRLDLAPGLTFLSRRSVMSSLLNGTLAVEPFIPNNYKFYAPIFACSLCGESRKQDAYVRKHRFRISESEDAQRYPLCEYCLGRIRATGDFLGFLRLLKDGHWRCESEQEEKGAWEEAVRLRERMFWARVGGGVVPAAFRRDHVDSTREADRKSSAEIVAHEASKVNAAEKETLTVPKAAAQPAEAANAVITGATDENAKTTAGQVDDDDDAALKDDVRASLEEAPSIRRALVNISSAAATTMVPSTPPPPQEAKIDSDTEVEPLPAMTDESTSTTVETHEQEQPHDSEVTGKDASEDEFQDAPTDSPAQGEEKEDEEVSQSVAGASEPRSSTPPPVEHQSSITSFDQRPGTSSSSQSQPMPRRSKEIAADELAKRPSSLSAASLPAPEPPASGRRPSSSVLDRVRAMEAKASGGASDSA